MGLNDARALAASVENMEVTAVDADYNDRLMRPVVTNAIEFKFVHL